MNYYNNSYNLQLHGNYTQEPTENPDKLDWLLLWSIGLIVPITIILIWILWAYKTFRYHDDRISPKLLKKYNIINGKNIDNEKYYAAPSNIFVSNDRTKVTADVQILDKETNEMLNSSLFIVQINDECSPISSSCISL